MAKKYMHREWQWWLSLNSHECRFCHKEYLKTASFGKGSQRFEDMHLGVQTGSKQARKGYWPKLYQVWLRHMKQYHPEIVKVFKQSNQRGSKMKVQFRPKVCEGCPTFEKGCEGSNQEDCQRTDNKPKPEEEAESGGE